MRLVQIIPGVIILWLLLYGLISLGTLLLTSLERLISLTFREFMHIVSSSSFFFFLFFPFRVAPSAFEVPRPGVELELQLRPAPQP